MKLPQQTISHVASWTRVMGRFATFWTPEKANSATSRNTTKGIAVTMAIMPPLTNNDWSAADCTIRSNGFGFGFLFGLASSCDLRRGSVGALASGFSVGMSLRGISETMTPSFFMSVELLYEGAVMCRLESEVTGLVSESE